MKKGLRHLNSGISAILALSVLGTQCLFAYQPEKDFWTERRKAMRRTSSTLLASRPLDAGSGRGNSLTAQFPTPQSVGAVLSPSLARSVPACFSKDAAKILAALSPANGTIRKVSLPKDPFGHGPVVIHIQDVHMNQEAQWNIRETVKSLLRTGQVNLVALEGATEDIDLQAFVNYPHAKAVEMAADYLLKENKISGPIHAILTAKGNLPRILGVDDPLHYEANVQAYRDSAPKLEKTHQKVLAIQKEIEARKKVLFSSALQSFDQQVQLYRAGKSSLGEYVRVLANKTTAPVPPPALSQEERGEPLQNKNDPVREDIAVRRFLDALEMERTLDFKKVESERTQLIERLAQTLTTEETQTLMDQSLAYRSGQLRYADFYTRLKHLCERKGIPLTVYPALDAYIQYVLLSDEIEAERLMADISALEKKAYGGLTKTPEERALVARSRHAWLMEKLTEFALAPSEWMEYTTGAPEIKTQDLSSFEAFYREAQSRDMALAGNLLKGIQSSSPRNIGVSVLVTGGYHAESIERQLVREGITVVSYVPRIQHVDTAQGSRYLSVFTQEKSPLEHLFAGNKLFLAPVPISSVDLKITAPLLVASAAVIHGFVSNSAGFMADYGMVGGLGRLTSVAVAQGVEGGVTLGGLSLIFKIAGAQKSFTVVETSLASKKPPLWNRVQLFSKRTDTHTNPSSLAYWMAKRLGAGESRARQIGWWGLLIEIPALCGMSSLAKDLTDRNIHVLSLLGLDPLTTGLVVVFFFLFAALHFTSAMEMNKRFGRDPPSQGILWMTMGVFLLYLVPGLWWFAVAVHLAFDMVHFSQAKLVPLDRRYLTAPEMLVGGRSITMVDPQMGHGKNIGTTSGRAILEFNGEWAVLLNPTGHWEFVGGGVGEKETIQEALPREIEEETGILKEKVLLHFLGDSTSDTAHFAYQYAKPGHDPVTRYVRVAMASFSRKPKIKISREHVKFKWVSPQTMREHLGDYTLNTRISLFLWILENEYGMRDVLSLIPLEHMTYARSTGPALLVKARSGDFVLHRAGMDVDGARFGVAFQQHLFDSGLPVPEVRERISAKGPERSPLLLLGGEPMVLERYLTAGKPIGRDQAEERHFTEIGKLVGKIQSVSENFIPPSGPFSSHSVNGDSVENRWLPLHGDLHFGNLHFDERDGTIAALFDFEHAKLGPRFEEILVSLYGSNKAEFREAYIKGFNETATTPLTEREVRRVLNGTLSHRTPSTLRWLWRGGSGVGALDAILNRARWETLPPVIAMGCVLLSGASLGWAGGVVLLTGAWGLAHFFGTYGVKEGHLVHWSGDVLASIPKALSWMWWISLFGGLLWGAGQVVPATMVPVVFALGTWGAAYVEMKRHADANRRWVADHVPGLTDEERGIARTILKNLEGRTSLLGVNEFSEWRTRTAQRVAVGPLGFKIDLSLPPVSLGQGPTLLLADEAMLNGKGLENLREWMRHDPNILLVAESVVAGISEERLLLVPSAFGPREGKIQAARTVSLATVRRSGVLHPWGLQTPFRLAQTPNLLLDASHLAENDPLKNAAENPLVILLETMRAFPAGPTHWSGVLKVLQAIAAFA